MKKLNDKINYKIVIPARYNSSRLPGKPLRLIAGKPMLQHTYEQALQSQAAEVIIATDDQRIMEVAKQFTDNVIMTATEHNSGTERLAEVLALLCWSDDTIIVNVQGDEPLISPAHIDLVAYALHDNIKAGMSTIASEIDNIDDVFNSNIVKVVIDYQGYALYFSRASVPWSRDSFAKVSTEQNRMALLSDANWYRHIGLYAYRASALRHYVQLPPCMLEKTESLEQLRMLYNAIGVHVSLVQDQVGHGVDVEDDLEKVAMFYEQTAKK